MAANIIQIMENAGSFSAMALPVFDGENYQAWAVKMQAYLEAYDLWEAVEEDYEVLPLPGNPTMAQIKTHKERKMTKSKAKSSLFAAVSATIFSKVMTCKSDKEIWDFLKEYEGDERIRGMKVLNLVREFEMQRMNESETIKDYSDRLLLIANKVRILGTELNDNRIVQKILVTLPGRYEATIASLENTKDLSTLSLTELLSALQAQEQRRMMRQEGSIEGALQAKLQLGSGAARGNKGKGKKGNYEVTSARNNVTAPVKTKKANILLVDIVVGEIIHTSSVGENLL